MKSKTFDQRNWWRLRFAFATNPNPLPSLHAGVKARTCSCLLKSGCLSQSILMMSTPFPSSSATCMMCRCANSLQPSSSTHRNPLKQPPKTIQHTKSNQTYWLQGTNMIHQTPVPECRKDQKPGRTLMSSLDCSTQGPHQDAKKSTTRGLVLACTAASSSFVPTTRICGHVGRKARGDERATRTARRRAREWAKGPGGHTAGPARTLSFAWAPHTTDDADT